jgi:hypothetical protein
LGVISIVPSGGFAKVAMKAKLPNSFARKEMKMNKMQPWLHEMEVSQNSTPQIKQGVNSIRSNTL